MDPRDPDQAVALVLLFWIGLLMAMVAYLMFFCGCAPKPPTSPIPIAIVSPIPRAVHECDLPALPDQPVIVGFPDARTIYVTRDDLVHVLAYEASLMRWADGVQRCLAAHGEVMP